MSGVCSITAESILFSPALVLTPDPSLHCNPAALLSRAPGDWFKVEKLVRESGGDDAQLVHAWNKIGQYYSDRHKWSKAAQFYAQVGRSVCVCVCVGGGGGVVRYTTVSADTICNGVSSLS